jgi:hypothetical protein
MKITIHLLLICFFLLTGCRLVRTTASAPGRAVRTMLPGTRSDAPPPGELQSILLRYSDEYGSRTVQALDVVRGQLTETNATALILELKISNVSSAITLATGSNPNANLVDLVGLTTLSRKVVEEVYVGAANGESFRPWLRSLEQLEKDIWDIAEDVFQDELLVELRGMFNYWFETHPEIRASFFRQPHSFTSSVRKEAADYSAEVGGSGVLNIIGLDPLSGLDPATAELTESRLFAERALYTIQRMPPLLRWQSKLFMNDTFNQPRVQDAMNQTTRIADSADRASRVAESVGEVVAELPDRISAEREAFMNDLKNAHESITPMLSELKLALGAGEGMSTSLSTTLDGANRLADQIIKLESKPDSRPFDITDYATAAERIAEMATGLDGVLKELNATLESPAIDARFQSIDEITANASAEMRNLVTYAFSLAGALAVFVFALAFAYKKIVSRHPVSRAG